MTPFQNRSFGLLIPCSIEPFDFPDMRLDLSILQFLDFLNHQLRCHLQPGRKPSGHCLPGGKNFNVGSSDINSKHSHAESSFLAEAITVISEAINPLVFSSLRPS